MPVPEPKFAEGEEQGARRDAVVIRGNIMLAKISAAENRLVAEDKAAILIYPTSGPNAGAISIDV